MAVVKDKVWNGKSVESEEMVDHRDVVVVGRRVAVGVGRRKLVARWGKMVVRMADSLVP